MSSCGKIFYKHSDQDVMARLDALFCAPQLSKAALLKKALSFDNDNAGEAVNSLFKEAGYFGVSETDPILYADSIERTAGFTICEFEHGSEGPTVIEEIVCFLARLVEGLHVQAWGCGDEDPWEYWLRSSGSEWFKAEDSYEDSEEDRRKIYATWHAGLPKEIREGIYKDSLL